MPAELPLVTFYATAVPWWLVVSLRHRYHLDAFVETGTGYGDTAAIAAQLFPRVVGMELDPVVYSQQRQLLQEAGNAQRLCGDSRQLLPTVLEDLPERSLFYLDAHWTGCGEPPTNQCPLLEELVILAPRLTEKKDVVIIDDAGMFLHPPWPPNDPAQWPTAGEIRRALRPTGLSLAVLCNVIIATPEPVWQPL